MTFLFESRSARIGAICIVSILVCLSVVSLGAAPALADHEPGHDTGSEPIIGGNDSSSNETNETNETGGVNETATSDGTNESNTASNTTGSTTPAEPANSTDPADPTDSESESNGSGVGQPAPGPGPGPGPGTGTGTTSPDTTGTNGTDGTNSSGGGGGGGSGGDGGGGFSLPSFGMPELPGPGEMMEGSMEWLKNSLNDDIDQITTFFDEAFVGLSAPGDEFTVDALVAPEDGDWGVAHQFFVATLPIVGVAILFKALGVFMTNSRDRQWNILREAGTYALYVIGGYFLLGAYFYLLGEVATAISPGGTEFFNTTAGRSQLALSAIGLLILSGINAGLTLITGLTLYLIHELPIWLYAFWNLSWAAQCIPNDKIAAAGDIVPTATIMLAPARLIAACLLFLAAEMSTAAESPAEIFLTQIDIWIILLAVGIGIPLGFWKSYGVMAGMLMSRSAIAKANRAVSPAQSKLNNAAAKAIGSARDRASTGASRARESAGQRAANAKRTAMSRAGGVVLDARAGNFPRHPSARASEKSNPQMGSASESQSVSARQKAKNRMRRDAAIRSNRVRKRANRQSNDD